VTIKTYDIYFRGECVEGFSKTLAKIHLAEYLETSVEDVDRLFTGKPAIIREKVHKGTATHYINIFKKHGLICHVRENKQQNWQNLTLEPLAEEYVRRYNIPKETTQIYKPTAAIYPKHPVENANRRHHYQRTGTVKKHTSLSNILLYPLSGPGIVFILLYALTTLATTLFTPYPSIGYVISLLATGYFCFYMLESLRTSTEGEKYLDSLPSFKGIFPSFVLPLIFFSLPFLFCLGPACYLSYEHSSPHELINASLILGVIFLPLAFMLLGQLMAQTRLSSIHLMAAIARSFGFYTLSIIIVAVILYFETIAEVPFTTPLLYCIRVLEVYGFFVFIRLIGSIMYKEQHYSNY